MNRLSNSMRLTLSYLSILPDCQVVFGTGMWLVLRVKPFDIADAGLQGEAADLERLLQVCAALDALTFRTEISEGNKY